MAYKRDGYWYRSRRDGDRVTTEYLGKGPFAALRADMDNEAAIARRMAWAAQRAQRARVAALDRKLDAAGDALRLLVRAHLLAHGYHAHKGQWRKRRELHGEADGATTA